MSFINLENLKKSGLLDKINRTQIDIDDLVKIKEYSKRSDTYEINNDNLINIFSSILSNSPKLFNTLNHANSYVATFSPDGLALLESGKAVLKSDKSGNMLTSLFSESSGKILENAHLTSMLNPLDVAVIGFGLLTFITKQVHLHKINKNLENINSKLDYIQKLIETSIYAKIDNEITYIKILFDDISKSSYSAKDFHNSNTLQEFQNKLNNINIIVHELTAITHERLNKIQHQNFKKTNSYEEYFLLVDEILNLLDTLRIIVFIQKFYLFLLQFIPNSSSTISSWKEKNYDYLMSKLNQDSQLIVIENFKNLQILSWDDKLAYNYHQEKLDKFLKEFPKKDYQDIHEKINIKFKPKDTSNPALIKKIQELENLQNRLKPLQKQIDTFNRKKERRVLRPFNILSSAIQAQNENFNKLYSQQNEPIKIVFKLNQNGEIDKKNLYIELNE